MATELEMTTAIYNWVKANPNVASTLSNVVTLLSKLERVPSDFVSRFATLESNQKSMSTNLVDVKTAIGDKSDAKQYGLDSSLSLVARGAATYQALVEKPLSVDLKYTGPTITEIADEFVKRGEILTSQIEQLSEDIKETTSEACQSIKSDIGAAASNYQDSLGSFSKGISDQVDCIKAINVSIETTRSAITAAVSNLGKICTNLQTATATIVDLAPTVVADKQKVGETLLTIEGMTSEVAGITELLSRFTSQVSTFANLLASQQTSTEALANAIETTKGVITDSLAERDRHNVVTEAFDTIGRTVTTAFDESTKSHAENAQLLSATVEKALDKTASIVKDSLDSVQGSVGDCFDNVKDNMRSCFDNMTQSLTRVASEQTKRVDTIVQTVSEVEKQRSKDGNISLAVDTALRTPEMLESIKRLVKKEVDL